MRFVTLAALALALGLATLLYAGPGRGFVRGHVGDVAATMLVYAAFGLTSWSLRARAAATLAFAVAVAAGQLLWAPLGRSGVGALTLGSVFDPWDLVAYAVGVVTSIGWERRL
jgi:hypothetical protein